MNELKENCNQEITCAKIAHVPSLKETISPSIISFITKKFRYIETLLYLCINN